MNTEQKRKLVEEFYKNEELVWANLTKHYYTPDGAPARLSRLLLEQWHQKNNTGAKDPGEIRGSLVKVYLSDNSYLVKRFVTKVSANKYISALAEHDIKSELFNNFMEVHFG